jgi:short-subunit dehydrogenase
MELTDAVVLVTGSSHGIGEACAAELTARGAHVVLHGRSADVLGTIAAELGAKVVATDLQDEQATTDLAYAARDVYGRVDAVVHCAGIGWYGHTAAMPPAKLDELLRVNLRAPLQLTRTLLPDMVARGRGHVAFVASIAGLTGVACEAVYAATKAGLITFADSLRLELHGTGVGVSVVSPGAVRTNFFQRRGTPYGRRIPRPMPPARVATAVVRGMVRGSGDIVLPHWLALAPATRAVAPRVFEALNRQMG